MSKHLNIPVITDLVYSGDPRLKAQAKKTTKISSHLKELNKRIDEIETAIGQDATSSVGRAYAIRAEKAEDQRDKKFANRVLSEKEILKY